MRTITLIPGDGIGPEVTAAARASRSMHQQKAPAHERKRARTRCAR